MPRHRAPGGDVVSHLEAAPPTAVSWRRDLGRDGKAIAVDPVSVGVAALKTAADQLLSWRREAEAAAQNREAGDAAATIYFAGLLLAVIGALDDVFRSLEREIERLDLQRNGKEELARYAEELAESEVLVNRLGRAAGYLNQHASQDPGRLDRVLRKLGNKRTETEEILRDFASYAVQAQKWIGAREKAPTPAGITDVADAIRAADDDVGLAHAKFQAKQALLVVDRFEVRRMHESFGRLASELSRAHGIPMPDWQVE